MKKRRANGEGSFRKRSNGHWEGRFTIRMDPETGKAIQKSVSGKTKAECIERMNQAIQEYRGTDIRKDGNYSIAEWCRLWFEVYSKPNIRYNTMRCYQNVIENHIIPAIGQIQLKALSSGDIQCMYNEIRTKKPLRGTSASSNPTLTGDFVRRVHMVLHSALQQAVRDRLINYNPCKSCRIPPKEKKEQIIIPPEQIGAYLLEAERCGMLPLFYLELTSGLRRGELVALLWDDLDVQNHVLTVNKQITDSDGQTLVTEPKTQNSIRKVVVSKQAVDLLIQEHNRHPDNPILFPSPRTNQYWGPRSISRINKRLLQKAGIDPAVRFHDLRHTFATLAIQNGVDVKTLASMLGHYSASFTLDTYTHVTHKMQQSAAEKIGRFMADAEQSYSSEQCNLSQVDGCKIIPFTTFE